MEEYVHLLESGCVYVSSYLFDSFSMKKLKFRGMKVDFIMHIIVLIYLLTFYGEKLNLGEM